jgi:uncharacterized protein (TIGR00661 family)
MTRPLRVLFAVQGEGRGHMTQALAVREMLAAGGHTVCGALVGRSEARVAPSFFVEGMDAPVHSFDSPNFAYHPRTHAVSLTETVAQGVRRSGLYHRNLELIGRQVRALRPDVILNFYEGMTGLYALTARPEIPIVAVGHQYMFFHPAYRFAPGQPVARAATKAYTWLTAAGAKRLLALSFYEAEDRPDRRLRVTPPILRRDLFGLDGGRDDGFFLAYLLHRALAEGLVRWCEEHAEVRVRCFWDGEPWAPLPNLSFHPLDGERFLREMARCRGVVCTAGFESVSEAMWLGKPVYMMPTPRHLEQRTNALDAARTGAGLPARGLDLDAFLAYLPRYASPADRFRPWVARAAEVVLEEVERAARRPTLLAVPRVPGREAA